MHLSHTQLSMFDSCPRAYKYKYVDGLETPGTLPMKLGKCLHEAIALYGQKCDGRNIEMAKEIGEAAFEESDLPVGCLDDITAEMERFAENHWVENWQTEVAVEVEMAPGVQFKAVFDKVEAGIVTDWKSQRGWPARGDATTLAQLRRYAYAYWKQYGKPPVAVQVDYIRWWGRTMDATDTLSIGPDYDMEALERLVRADSLRLLSEQNYDPRPTPKCVQCPYQRTCLAAGIHMPPGLPIDTPEQAQTMLSAMMALEAHADTLREVLKAWGEENGDIERDGYTFTGSVVTSQRLQKKQLVDYLNSRGEEIDQFYKPSETRRWSLKKKGAKEKETE